tara:strand:+ start:541 stop:1527 length:987 start_codon:yes stop_codon:yes gene_type:complete
MNYKSYIVEQNIKSLENKISLFYGENLGLKKDFKDKLKSTNKNASLSQFTQDEILKNQNSFFDELFNLSLFNEEKVYFINDANDKILDIIKSLENKTSNQKIYIFADILEKKSKLRNYFEKSKDLCTIACYNDNELNLKKIVLDKLKNFEGLSPENISIILDNSNLDRIKLNNELEKIQTFFLKKKIITSDLFKLFNFNESADFKDLRDAALAGNDKKTNKLLSNTSIENEKIIFYLYSINQRLNKLNEILLIKDEPLVQVVEKIRPPVFWKDKPKIIEQAKKWNSKKIKIILKKTFDLEITIKSNASLDKNILIKKLLVDVCCHANS